MDNLKTAKLPPTLTMGVEVLTDEEAQAIDLGPLKQLKGTWVGNGFDGWNVIAVPGPLATGGPGGFVLEIIPYQETLTFTPVVTAGNRGTFHDHKQLDQQIVGFIYEQVVTSVCTIPRCVDMGFGAGTEIHAETGLLLYSRNYQIDPDGSLQPGLLMPYNLARLATVPHGNAILAMGTAETNVPVPGDQGTIFGTASTLPTAVDKGVSLGVGYDNVYLTPRVFPQFEQSNPNQFLADTLKDRNQVISNLTTIHMSSKNATGGILNMPFGDSVVKCVDMEATFWIEELVGSAQLQLQYSQTINLQFPGLDNKFKPTQVNWPHVTVSTLSKVSD